MKKIVLLIIDCTLQNEKKRSQAINGDYLPSCSVNSLREAPSAVEEATPFG